MREAVIVAGVRTAGGKAPRGTLRDVRPEFLGKVCIEEAIRRLGDGFQPDMIEDVIWGCATPEQVCGMNTARITALYAGIPDSVPAVTVNRFCSSGLQAIAFGAEAVMSGRCDVVLAGGVEHMSLISMGGVIRPNSDILADPKLRTVYTSMGQTAENVARRYGVARQEQDEFAVNSHRKAAQAMKSGRFKEEIVPVPVKMTTLDGGGNPVTKEFLYDYEEGIRYDATLESLGKLKPAFVPGGTVTAGQSSQMTDGAAAVIVMSADRARELGLKPRLRFVTFAVHGCAVDEMGIGPVFAIPKALKKAGLTLRDIGLIELNEAFASQSLYCIRELGLDPEIVNVNGGAIALGHPMGATGCKLSVTLMHEMERRKVRYGIVSMCVGGGQGAAGIFELC
ncbi:thiolase family protein [Papillibacter cinnamivorans]|uniref:Acetyl-CoA acetyltransferase n=1 Tax=Papillibacter cinnamivorans DSM 12816 TaxID=1122930 RepID=A0A1W2CBP5_9FIRM|nr:thiolase family protein [Papillibacter cinnamivorans]SMC82613.1 acetyl-CoA acyltransferase [Papillibacter cinnamivorans DSM 12816]